MAGAMKTILGGLLLVVHSAALATTAVMTSPCRFVKNFFRPASKEAGTGTATVQFRGREITAVKGELLRSALLRRGLTPHNGPAKALNCRAAAICGTCAVHIKKGKVFPEDWNIHEQFRLRLPPFTGSDKAEELGPLRLACQVEVVEDIEVVKACGAWGEGHEPSDEPAEDFKTYLGEGEFILDVAQSGFRRPVPKINIEYEADQDPAAVKRAGAVYDTSNNSGGTGTRLPKSSAGGQTGKSGKGE